MEKTSIFRYIETSIFRYIKTFEVSIHRNFARGWRKLRYFDISKLRYFDISKLSKFRYIKTFEVSIHRNFDISIYRTSNFDVSKLSTRYDTQHYSIDTSLGAVFFPLPPLSGKSASKFVRVPWVCVLSCTLYGKLPNTKKPDGCALWPPLDAPGLPRLVPRLPGHAAEPAGLPLGPPVVLRQNSSGKP